MIPDVKPPLPEKLAYQQSADIISVQSQVIYGSVGNSVVLPALTRHGWNVLAVPTFLLSNTPDYPSCYGGEISDEWFCGFLKGIHERNQDGQLRAVITGYLGSISKAQRLSDWLCQVIVANPDTQIIVDPVMGDDDTGFYVDSGLAGWYRDHLRPLATGMTPNRFELSCLCGKTLHNEQDVISSARSLLTERMRWIVVTSAARDETASTLQVICVTEKSVHIVEHQAYANAPKGTGDLFTAGLTTGLLRGLSLEEAAEFSCEQTRHCVLESLINGSGILNPLILAPGTEST